MVHNTLARIHEEYISDQATYPTMTDSTVSAELRNYDNGSGGVINPPSPSGMVSVGGYLFCSIASDGYAYGYLARFTLNYPQSGGTIIYNDTQGTFSSNTFSSSQMYNTGGYNDLGGLLTGQYPNGLTSDGTYVYIACPGSGKIVRMTVLGTAAPNFTYNAIDFTTGLSTGLSGLTISSDNLYLYALSSSASTVTKIQVSDGSILSTYSLGGTYAGKLYGGIVSNGDYLYEAYYGNGGTNTGSILRYGAGQSNVPCFGENTKILCLNTKILKEEYIQITNIRRGTLVKTLNGYIPVHAIGRTTIHSYANNDRIKNRLYKCKKENYPEINGEDLILTGCHSILVDELTDEQKEKTIQEIEQVFVTDRKYRLFTFLDPRAEPYDVEGEFPIYHFALENEDYYMNYGVYANGLLVESCSKRYLKELSEMTLIE
jgi:hypothetical protein